jgi:Gpi18-like mannosyltransferase
MFDILPASMSKPGLNCEPQNQRGDTTDARPSRWASLADAITVLLGSVALLAAMHPFELQVGTVHLSVRNALRPLIAAVLIGTLRHALARQPPLHTRLRHIWIDLTRRYPAATAAIPIAIATRVAILVVGYIAAIAIPFPKEAPFQSTRTVTFWELPQRWDAGWYLSIVRDGYQWRGDVTIPSNLNFFPAYPLLVRMIAALVRIPNAPENVVLAWTATTVSIVAFIAASVYLHRFARDRFGDRVASDAVVLTAAYPFAVFYSAVYSEALFLLCSIAAWYHLDRSEPVASGVWGVLAGLCRPNGVLLTVPLLMSVWITQRRDRMLYVAALAPIFGTVLFSAYAFRLTGHAVVWAELQRAAWYRTYRGLDQSLFAELNLISRAGIVQYVSAWPWRSLNVAATFMALVAVWPTGRRLGVPAGAFVFVSALVPLLSGGFESLGRYTATLFPMFVWLALDVPDRRVPLLACCFGIGQALVAVSFFTWRPIF